MRKVGRGGSISRQRAQNVMKSNKKAPGQKEKQRKTRFTLLISTRIFFKGFFLQMKTIFSQRATPFLLQTADFVRLLAPPPVCPSFRSSARLSIYSIEFI